MWSPSVCSEKDFSQVENIKVSCQPPQEWMSQQIQQGLQRHCASLEASSVTYSPRWWSPSGGWSTSNLTIQENKASWVKTKASSYYEAPRGGAPLLSSKHYYSKSQHSSNCWGVLWFWQQHEVLRSGWKCTTSKGASPHQGLITNLTSSQLPSFSSCQDHQDLDDCEPAKTCSNSN